MDENKRMPQLTLKYKNKTQKKRRKKIYIIVSVANKCNNKACAKMCRLNLDI